MTASDATGKGAKMSHDFSNIKLPLQKVIELGQIDRWLRGIAEIVPHPAPSEPRFSPERDMHSGALTVVPQDFNTHILAINAKSLVGTDDIERMVGFRNLLSAASKQNVRVDISSADGKSLEVSFDPDEVFSRSRVFGASYSNVLPAIFSKRKPPLATA